MIKESKEMGHKPAGIGWSCVYIWITCRGHICSISGIYCGPPDKKLTFNWEKLPLCSSPASLGASHLVRLSNGIGIISNLQKSINIKRRGVSGMSYVCILNNDQQKISISYSFSLFCWDKKLKRFHKKLFSSIFGRRDCEFLRLGVVL